MPTNRVLIIDDEDDIREVAQTSLELIGELTVSTARSSREGLAKAIAELPDAILLDVMLPDMDGPTTLKQLQDNPITRNIPVIFLTAKAQSTEQRRFGKLGAAGVIAKPFDPVCLASQVAAVLGWSD